MRAIGYGKTGEVRVEARLYNGKPQLDIRRWFQGKDGVMQPTGKGVTLNPEQAESLVRALGSEMPRLRELREESKDG